MWYIIKCRPHVWLPMSLRRDIVPNSEQPQQKRRRTGSIGNDDRLIEELIKDYDGMECPNWMPTLLGTLRTLAPKFFSDGMKIIRLYLHELWCWGAVGKEYTTWFMENQRRLKSPWGLSSSRSESEVPTLHDVRIITAHLLRAREDPQKRLEGHIEYYERPPPLAIETLKNMMNTESSR